MHNQDNPLWARAALGVLAGLVAPLAVVEEYGGRTLVNAPHDLLLSGTRVGEHAGEAYLLGKAGEPGEAAAHVLSALSHGATAFGAGATIGATATAWSPTKRLQQATTRGESSVRVGAYKEVGGHHVHQSAAYAETGPARQMNPNHADAISIPHGPGFTRDQHRLADSVQRNLNRAVRGKSVNQPCIGPAGEAPRVTISVTGEGSLPPAPTPWFEDIKAYGSLRAARPQGAGTPDAALDLVTKSADQLGRSGTSPVRVPTR